VLAAVSPGEPWLLWWPFYDSAVSANADGVPLMAKRIAGGAGPLRLAPRMLATTGFMTWCGSRLVFAAGFDRYTTNGKRLLAAGAPLWRSRELSRDRTRSWVSPACSPDGRRLAVSAGRNWVESRFGLERRSIWILSPDGRSRRRLTAPPAGRTDEVPRWSADGRAVLFVRSGPTAGNATARGFLYVVRPGAAPLGPIVDLGRTGNYYGQYGWAGQTDWFEPR
jgi:dipeptidyl aminopeptidase/acylaminoacyl peptidase